MKNFNIEKKDPVIKLVRNSLASLPTPSRISFLWNIGFLLGITLRLQIITGIILSINYIPHTQTAFESVIHIIRDIDKGWIIRYSHINGASLFFLVIYTHIARGIYFNSAKKTPTVWISGRIILLVSIIAAFIGYVLPWGQISYWGATVITRILSSFPYIGENLIIWLWGDFSVSQPTLNRIFSLHFLAPIALAVLALIHLIFLHNYGSSNPSGLDTNLDKTKFFPTFIIKDTLPIFIIIVIFRILISLTPDILGDPENFNPARITTTPTHIKPEWYFLFAYAILRSIPSKLGGVIAIGSSILVIALIRITKKSINKKFNPSKKVIYWIFITTIMILTWLGGKPVNDLTTLSSQIITIVYFLVAIII